MTPRTLAVLFSVLAPGVAVAADLPHYWEWRYIYIDVHEQPAPPGLSGYDKLRWEDMQAIHEINVHGNEGYELVDPTGRRPNFPGIHILPTHAGDLTTLDFDEILPDCVDREDYLDACHFTPRRYQRWHRGLTLHQADALLPTQFWSHDDSPGFFDHGYAPRAPATSLYTHDAPKIKEEPIP